ncbi:MAG: copper chaperone PCu(A)C [Advenella sp.]|uniref:Transporter n=1 Tax=Advenella kashmirensis TaxID=310575 RepID=A0A356LGK6_9BURK|nr:copper chaperone PCu(A)C [Advenella sp. FME57]HBP29625.1 transporter [Advenella kashmirensis]
MSIFINTMAALLSTFMVASASYAQIIYTQVKVDDPWVRATVPQQTTTGAFMLLTAQSDSKLVSAASPVAEHVELHTMTMENDIMKMRQIPELALAAAEPVALKSGGYHIMLIGLKKQISEGNMIPMTLTFEDNDGNRTHMQIQATARSLHDGASNNHQ